MKKEVFSIREKLAAPGKAQSDELNARTRSRLAHVLSRLYGKVKNNIFWQNAVDNLHDIAGLPPKNLLSTTSQIIESQELIGYLAIQFLPKAKWFHIFDLFEILKKHLDAYVQRERLNSQMKAGLSQLSSPPQTRWDKKQSIISPKPVNFIELETANYLSYLNNLYASTEKETNKVLAEENVAWVLENGLFQRRIDQIKVIRITQSILESKEFSEAHKHHEKAWAAFNQRPNPDLVGCMRDAWDAVEIVAKHCAGLDGGTFDDAFAKLIEKCIVLDDWKQTIKKFYGLACNWFRHPKPDPLPCKIEDAEMFLVIASQIILYMVSGYKRIKI